MRATEFTVESDEEHRAALNQTGFWGKQGAGCLFLAKNTGRICIAHRSQAVEQPGTWGTWGGAIDSGEDPAKAVRREVKEEAGYTGQLNLIPLFIFSHPSGFKYYNFLALVDKEFIPITDWETQNSAWFDYGHWPKPLHPGLVTLLHDSASTAIIQKYAHAETEAVKPTMRTNEIISELFDGGKEWKWTYQDKNEASAAFTVGDVHYTFIAWQDPDEAPGDWDIEFAAKQQHGTASWGITGTGNSAQVFGTVVEIMKAFITSKKASIRRMTFAAKEDSRQGLYARMVKRLLPKWNLEQNGEAFILTRPGGLVFWVYSVDALYNKIPAVKVKANSAKEAEQIVLTTRSEFKGADLMGMVASKNKPDLSENFADGKNPEDKGDSARHGIPKGATMTQLEKASHAKGRKGQLARWQLNMRRGKAK